MFKQPIHPDENIIQVYRTHEITLVPKVLKVFVLIFIPWFFGLKYNFIFDDRTHTILFLFWTILVAIYALNAFLMWNLSVYMVTSKRLLHINYTSLFQKMVSETPLDRILNVSFSTKGFFSTLFNFGDVFVQIVGLDRPLVLQSVPEPAVVKDDVWRMHLEFGGEQKITYTTPEIAPVDKYIPYAPKGEGRIINRDKPRV